MGDRVWTGVSFSGHATTEVAEGLISQLEGQGCHCDDGPEGDLSIEHLKLDVVFYDDQCNYGTMEGVENYCREHNISYLKTWEAGGGYGSGLMLYNAVVGEALECATADGDPSLGLEDLKSYREKGKTLDEVITYLGYFDKFRDGFPVMEVSE